MPLNSYNRLIVKLGLLFINKYHYSAFTLLSTKTFFDENVLSMEIVPKINAIGRLCKGSETNRLLHFFTSSNLGEQSKLASWMETINLERKNLTKEASSHLNIDPREEAIVTLTDLPEGLNGLLASRLLSQYDKPVAVFSRSFNDENVLVGSLRSKEGFNILKALEENHANFLSHGGHAFAGGVSIKKEDFESFKKDFLFAALKHKLTPLELKQIPLEKEEITMDNYKILRNFGPFGSMNPAPMFLYVEDAEKLTYSPNGQYLNTALGKSLRLFSFAYGEKDLPRKGNLKLSVTFGLNEWKGRFSIDLLVNKFVEE
jgi:single-stranded-DNA-specific exonuclease